MCKCEKKVENGNEVEVGVLMGIIDILDEIFGNNTTNAAKACVNSINLDEEIDHVVFNDPATIVFWKDGTKTVMQAMHLTKKQDLQCVLFANLQKTNIIIMCLKNIAAKKNKINIDK